MNISMRFLIILFFSLNIISCGLMMDIFLDSNKTAAKSYDELKCTNGPASPPGITRRQGCVNDGTEFENRIEFNRYQKELDIHKAQKENNEK